MNQSVAGYTEFLCSIRTTGLFCKKLPNIRIFSYVTKTSLFLLILKTIIAKFLEILIFGINNAKITSQISDVPIPDLFVDADTDTQNFADAD